MAAKKKPAASKRPVGRPLTTMTKENIEAVLRAVRMGLHPDRAAEAAGISAGTMRKHKLRNQEFATALKEAAAEAEKSYLGRIIQHSETQWTAAAWILERRWAERWRKKDSDDIRRKLRSEPVKDQKDMHELLMQMVSAAAAGKITPKQLRDMAQSLGIASDISERADLEERIKKLEDNG